MLRSALVMFFFFALFYNAEASFQTFLTEFQEKNLVLKNAADRQKLADFDEQIINELNAWNLSSSFSYVNNLEEPAGAFNTNQIKAKEYNLNFSKKFTTGTELEFSNKLTSVNREEWIPILLGDSPLILKEFSQRISLSQSLGADFLGRQSKVDLLIASINKQTAQVQYNQQQQDLMQEFFKNYILAKRAKSIIALQLEAVKRAEKQRNNLKKRVRDGTSNKVDLYQARLTLISQQENLKQAKEVLVSALEQLSDGLHRIVGEREVKGFSLKRKYKNTQFKGEIDKNLDVQLLKNQLEVAKSSAKKADFAIFPEIKLSGSLRTNDFDEATSIAFKEGNIFKDQREYIIGVELKMPLGFATSKAEKAKQTINKMIAERELQALKARMNILEDQLHKNEKNNFDKVQLSQKRRQLARITLKEQNRLYNLGRADFDQVLRSENELINAQVSLVNNLSTYFQIQVLKYKLYGSTVDYLKGFKG